VGFFLAPRSPFISSQRKVDWQTARIPLIARRSGKKYVQFASVESQGFCHYKCTNGIKQHLAVDTSQLAVFIHWTKASVSDDCALIEMLSHNLDYFHTRARQYSEDYHSARTRGITGIRSSQRN
jgi:hypothetical protein